MTRPNIDVFGHCIMCGKKVIEERIINNVPRVVFTGDKAEAQYLLDDGSLMRVCMCKSCVETLDGTEQTHVMSAVKRGWQHELETYSTWPQERKDNYMKKYGALDIITRADNKQDDVLNKMLKKHNKTKQAAKKDKKLKEKKDGNSN